MKKKILIGTVNLEVGGIEKTLISLLNAIDYKKYEVDLLLLKTNGDLINEVNKNVNIITPYKGELLKDYPKIVKDSLHLSLSQLVENNLLDSDTLFLLQDQTQSVDSFESYLYETYVI